MIADWQAEVYYEGNWLVGVLVNYPHGLVIQTGTDQPVTESSLIYNKMTSPPGPGSAVVGAIFFGFKGIQQSALLPPPDLRLQYRDATGHRYAVTYRKSDGQHEPVHVMGL